MIGPGFINARSLLQETGVRLLSTQEALVSHIDSPRNHSTTRTSSAGVHDPRSCICDAITNRGVGREQNTMCWQHSQNEMAKKKKAASQLQLQWQCPLEVVQSYILANSLASLTACGTRHCKKDSARGEWSKIPAGGD